MADPAPRDPPGAPGIAPRWTSSAKSAIGTALRPNSRVWFTLSHGIFNEVYYPRTDQACIRDMGLLVSDGGTFFSEEKRHTDSRLSWLAPGVPAFHVENRCRQGRYRITKDILCDPYRDVVLQQTRFEATGPAPSTFQVYVLLAPHLASSRRRDSGVGRRLQGRCRCCSPSAMAPAWR
ncbi:MAG: hypothetical protein R2708_24080 [Vicinamibacterales bacterium]